ncbi:MAG: hypothetical protein IT371_20440 [Deltaproteobacteria bacterium]|nr:hypothetical protein [Deltaproteobacteria bacterium]
MRALLAPRSVATSALLVGLLAATSGRADELEAQLARQKEAAYASFELGRYADAIAAFQRAYGLRRDPRLLYNLGLSYYKKHELEGLAPDLVQAREHFRRFLALVSPHAYPRESARILKVRALATGYLAAISRKEASTQVTPPGPGPSHRPVPAPRRSPSPSVASPNVASPNVASSPAPAPTPPPPRRRAWAHWLLYGVTGAAGLAAAVTGGLALRAASQSEELGAAGDRAGANERASRSRALALGTDVLFVSAAVTVTVAALLHWRSHRREPRLRATLGGVVMGWAF